MDTYEIQINEVNRNNHGNDSFEIGYVLKNGVKYVPILNKGADMHNGYSMAINFNGKQLRIHMDNTYRQLLYNNFNIIQPLIFHEIGHLENGDFYKDPIPNELRIAMVEMGKVLPNELAADNFAANIVGKNALKESIRYLLNLRKNTPVVLMNYSQELNIKELELRINNL